MSIQELDYQIQVLDEYIDIVRCQTYLYEFVKRSWSRIEGPDVPFIDSWHIGATCEHLQAAADGDLPRLLIAMPPRCMKSTMVSVAFCPWLWLTVPNKKFLYSSYDLQLSFRDSVRSRVLIESEWYQRICGGVFQLNAYEKNIKKFSNNRFGHRVSTSSSAGVTGHGGDIRIIDDPNQVSLTGHIGENDIKREAVNNWYGARWVTRFSSNDVQIVCAQRTDELDLIGHILASELGSKFVYLKLPMEYEKHTPTRTIILPSTNGKVWEDPRKEEGELLFPGFINAEKLKELKAGLGNEYRIAGQLQQRPAPAEGGLIKKHFFQWWKKETLPEIVQIIQSWDCALDDKRTCSDSACTTWGIFTDENQNNKLILLNMWRGKVAFHELRKLAKKMYKDYLDDGKQKITPNSKRQCQYVLIENKATGPALISSLRRTGIPAIGFDPTPYGDKVNRVQLTTPILEAGLVYVVAAPPSYLTLRNYSNEFVDLCAMFPNSPNKDVVDTMSQILLKLDFGLKLIVPEDRRKPTKSRLSSHVQSYGAMH